VIADRAFTVEPWRLREQSLDLDRIAQTESVFALANGHIGLRANLDEGEPHGLPGTYLNGVYELRPLPYAEAGYGYPESGQTVINVTNGKLIRLLVDDELFDLRYGTLQSHERRLEFRDGLLHRDVEWTSPAGRTIKVSSTRLVSFTHRAVAAICYEVEPVDGPARFVLQSELVANEQMPDGGRDPRASAVLAAPLAAEYHGVENAGAVLVHQTRHSELRVAAAMSHELDSPVEAEVRTEAFEDLARSTIVARLEPGQRLRLVKFLAYGWSASRSLPALRDQVSAALAGAKHTGWQGLLDEQRAYLDDFWSAAAVDIDGDTEIEQAIRFALFHVLQSSARAEQRAIPAKGLTGPGYDGHSFWDTEVFVLPVLSYSQPDAVAQALRWRYNTLPMARERAAQLGLKGAVFPWRTIHGEECSSYWPAGTAAFHISADVAQAVVRYLRVTGDADFEREFGLELLVDTARMWRSLGHHDAAGKFRIDGVTGPDEYSAIADNNIYTNLMAQRNLRAAADAAERWPREAHYLGVDDEETASWRDAANDMTIPFNATIGVHEQSEGFTRHEVWDFDASKDNYPLLLHYPYFDLYRKQVVKQADLVLAMQMCTDAFTPEQKARNFGYYDRLTVRDSSLSACTQSVLAAEVGHLDLALDYLAEAALMDLDDLEHNTRDGLHMASLAGACVALVAGLGGLRDHGGALWFAPRLPAGLSRVAFRLRVRGRRLHVEIRPEEATYTVAEGDPLPLRHHGEEIVVSASVTRPIPPAPAVLRPSQPPGREPRRRHPH
jgi:alpha,alpha-trehalose phosphorylase